MAGTVGYNAWKLAFELSPIIFKGGIFKNFPFQMMPIIALTEAVNFATGLLTAPEGISLDNCFCHYTPMPGATMIDQDIAHYPFANQVTAANSALTKPLSITYQMICPARGALGMFTKLPVMMLLQTAFEQHNRQGGLYHCLTPSFLYANCVMRSMRDTSSSGTKQVQTSWALDFEKPLITLDDAQGITSQLNDILDAANGGKQVIGQPPLSGLQTSAVAGGAPPGTSAIVPVATNTPLPVVGTPSYSAAH
jgi:hypothetical protein